MALNSPEVKRVGHSNLAVSKAVAQVELLAVALNSPEVKRVGHSNLAVSKAVAHNSPVDKKAEHSNPEVQKVAVNCPMAKCPRQALRVGHLVAWAGLVAWAAVPVVEAGWLCVKRWQ